MYFIDLLPLTAFYCMLQVLHHQLFMESNMEWKFDCESP